MADLNVESRMESLPSGDEIALVEVSGSVDASTFPAFQDKLVEVCSKDGMKAVVDMGGCEYINSTGVGLMVALAGEVRKQNGDICLIGLTEDVRHTMSLLGLLSIFKEYDSFDECVAAMSKPEAEAAVEVTAAAGFPKRLRCKGCDSILTVASPGKFVCPSCSMYLAAEDDGKVRVFRPLHSQSVTQVLPTDFAWGQPLIAAAEVLASSFDFADGVVEKLSHAVDEIWSNIASGRGENKNETCQIMMVGNKQGIVMGFILYHRKIMDVETSQGSVFMRAISAYADDVQAKSLGESGQVLRVVMKNPNA
jgi:anti-sigma B factor antagonist